MKDLAFVGKLDLNLTLSDEALEPHNPPTRRMIANATIGVEPEDAYYSTRELREAVLWVHEGESRGKARLATILSTKCDDFQRCLYYCLAGRGVVRMLDDLEWLEALLLARTQAAAKLAKEEVRAMPLVRPYVAECPDGPLVSADPEFCEGPSWYLDPELEQIRQVANRGSWLS